ncbi:hypothetical protein PG996_008710 [Apiospora saccharicola]|uniref:Uncharacterized protein n=1 Tax=Apiospora saccharicola TaxID=335842 RepID=A0ABR1UYR0_9PEZI
MDSSSSKVIRYSAAQLIKVGRDMKSSVPTIAYCSPKKDGPQYFCWYLQNALREGIKRVHYAAKPLDHFDKKYVANGDGRNRWVILLETVTGKFFSVDLKQIDPLGNTLVGVKPGIINPVEGVDSDHKPLPEFADLSAYAFSKCDELKHPLNLWSFFERIDGFGLTRYQLCAHWVDDDVDGGDPEGDLRGKF